jgi:peptide/nickel transport system substrate-binding protein
VTISRRNALRLAVLGMALTACGKPAAGSGGILRHGAVAAGGGAVSDPHGALFNESDWMRMGAIYDVLTVPGENGVVLPRLARRWTADPTMTRWRFDLRRDAVFTDGRPVRAADVLYSLRRIADKAAANGGRLGTVDAQKSTVDGDFAVVLVTSRPDADLPRSLAGVTFVVPAHTEKFDQPVGSGPFRLTKLADPDATLVRNEKWWGPLPGLDGLELRGFSDPQALAAAVTSGAIDVAASVGPTVARQAAGSSRLVVSTRPGAESYPLLMRLDKAPFDRPAVRRAVKMAVDRQALVDTVLLGHGVVGNDAPSPTDPSFPRDLPAPRRDPTRARELLTREGFPNGIDVVLHTTTAYPGMVSSATLLARQLAEAGIHAEVRQHPPATYWTRVYTVEPLVVGYHTDVTFPVWVRQTALSTSAYNETGWRDAAFDTAFATALATGDDQRRAGLLRDLQKRMADEGGWLLWGYGDGIDVASSTVKGLPKGPGFARMFLDQVRLDG